MLDSEKKTFGKYTSATLNNLTQSYRLDIRITATGGNGYLDVKWLTTLGNDYWIPWTWKDAYLTGKLYNSSGVLVDLTGATFGTTGIATGTSARILKSGTDFSAYSSSEMTFVWDETTKHPMLLEI